MTWNRTNCPVLAEHRVRFVSFALCRESGEHKEW
jgi:hypothetical protein